MAPSSFSSLNTAAMGGEIVTLHIGSKRKEFAIHRKLLCDKSDFFSKAFNTTSNFKESSDGVMYLPEDDPDAFEAFVNWIYRDQVPLFIKESNDDIGSKYRNLLVSFYILAEKYCINELANKIMDALQDNHYDCDRHFGSSQILNIYTNTCKGSSLRRYCTLMVLRYLKNKDNKELSIRNYTKVWDVLGKVPDLALDAVRFQIDAGTNTKKTPSPRVRSTNNGYGRCYFHTHSEGEECHLWVGL